MASSYGDNDKVMYEDSKKKKRFVHCEKTKEIVKHVLKGKARKKNKNIDVREEEYKKAPHSFVFHRGHVGRNVKQLVMDTRKVMEPFTAKSLQARKKNVLKDYVSVAGLLNVTHFIVYTKSNVSINMKLARLPRGPTLTFKVLSYSLITDVVSSLKKPNLEQLQYLNHPLLVMNNFSSEGMHMKLMSSMLQNMFPSINVHKVKLNDVKRCLLANYNTDTDTVEIRHYNIKVVPVGMSRNLKKLVVQAKIPDLSKLNDISDYVHRMGYSSESEAELDGPMNEVVLPQQINSRGNIKSAKSAIRLTELGPRLTLKLVKIEEGVCEGEVMYHALINKTDEEMKAQEERRLKKSQLKESRKKQQLENVSRKKQKLEEHKQRSLEGMRRKAETDQEAEIDKPEIEANDSEDDDVDYYKQEVGVRPDSDTFLQGGVKRKKKSVPAGPPKKRKFGDNKSSDTSKHFSKDKTDFSRDRPYKGPKGNKFDVKDEKTLSKGKGQKTDRSDGLRGKRFNRDDETKGKKGKREGMTIQEKLKLKKKKKLRMKEKKTPKYKRKLK